MIYFDPYKYFPPKYNKKSKNSISEKDIDEAERFIEWCEENNYTDSEVYRDTLKFLEKYKEEREELVKFRYNRIYLKTKLY